MKDVADDMPVSFVEMSSVSNDGYIERTETRPLAGLRKGSYTYFADNDVILAKITPCMENGKCALAQNLSNGLALGSSEFHVVRAAAEVLPGFLFALLNRSEIRQEAERNMTGSSGHRRVPIAFYEDLKFPVPPLAEQQILLDALAALETQIAAAQAVITGAPARQQAVLRRHLQGVGAEAAAVAA